VYSHGLPAYGGVNNTEGLNVLEAAGVKEMGHYSESPEALFWLSQITRVGMTGIFVDGVSVNDSAAHQQMQIAAVTPGERLPDATNPGLVMKEAKPYLAFGSIGTVRKRRPPRSRSDKVNT